MLNHSFILTRSKSDDHISKSKVLSPTPIRDNNAFLLNQISHLSSFQRKLDTLESAEPENRFIIRKFQSLNTFEMEQRYRESLGDTEPLIDARLPSESQVSIHDLIRMGSGYHGVQIGEIPVRSSNPIIRDARFAQADDAIMNKYSSAQTSSDAEVSTSVEVSSDASTNLKAY